MTDQDRLDREPGAGRAARPDHGPRGRRHRRRPSRTRPARCSTGSSVRSRTTSCAWACSSRSRSGPPSRPSSTTTPMRALAVITGDGRINEAQRHASTLIARTIATQSPVARDLRFLLSLDHVTYELERIGDHAASVAKQARKLAPEPPLKHYVRPARDGRDRGVARARRSCAPWSTSTRIEARAVAARDDEIDDLYHKTFAEVVDLMRAEPRQCGARHADPLRGALHRADRRPRDEHRRGRRLPRERRGGGPEPMTETRPIRVLFVCTGQLLPEHHGRGPAADQGRRRVRGPQRRHRSRRGSTPGRRASSTRSGSTARSPGPSRWTSSSASRSTTSSRSATRPARSARSSPARASAALGLPRPGRGDGHRGRGDGGLPPDRSPPSPSGSACSSRSRSATATKRPPRAAADGATLDPMATQLHFLRHAHAGDPAAWDAPDASRPLSEKGERQADRLGRYLATIGLAPDAHDHLTEGPSGPDRGDRGRPPRRPGRRRSAAGRSVRPRDLEAILERRRRPGAADRRRARPGLQRLVAELVGAVSIPMRKGALARIDIDAPPRARRRDPALAVPAGPAPRRLDRRRPRATDAAASPRPPGTAARWDRSRDGSDPPRRTGPGRGP